MNKLQRATLISFGLFLITSCTLLSVADKKPVPIAKELSEKTWLLAGYHAGRFFVPLEPGNGTTAWIMFNSDGSINGDTGMNTFFGTWTLKKTSAESVYSLSIRVKGMTRMAAPNEIASQFEQDLIKQLEEATILKTGKDSIRLFNEQNETLLQFIYRKSTLLF